jgi:hypothetical protein
LVEEIEILQNDLAAKYAINNRMTLNLTARYWSYSDVKEFYTLQNNGEIVSNPTYTLNRNRNFNSWNFDLSYSWWFAPGSEMSVLYQLFTRDKCGGTKSKYKFKKMYLMLT